MRVASTAWVLAAVLAAPRAWAQDAAPSTEVDSLLLQANDLRRRGRDEDAVALLRRAAALDQGPRTLAQLALGEQSIGRWAQSEALFVRALASVGDPWIERHRATLEASLAAARAHLATVDVVGGDPTAELWVEGERVGALSEHRQLRVVIGSVRIEHRPANGPPAVRVIEVSAGAHERVFFARIEGTIRATTATTLDASPTRGAPLATPGASTRQVPGSVDRSAPAIHGLVWVGVAASGTAIASNLILWAVAQSAVQRYDAACRDAPSIDVAACAARARAEQPQLDAMGTATDVGWAVLAAGIATSGVGVVLSVRERSVSVRGQF